MIINKSIFQFIHIGTSRKSVASIRFTFIFRKKWLDSDKGMESTQHFNISSQKRTTGASIQSNSTIELMITCYSSDERSPSFIYHFKPTFIAVPFSSLNINCKEISIRIFIRIIDFVELTYIFEENDECNL